ncbi:MAG: DNA polymerase I [Alphaproteobacteria bacterium]|nr:DNA polymerase I [Alphaproteobacteria bacterium]
MAEKKKAGAGNGNASPERLYLIDGSGFIFRAFHSSPLDAFKRSDGIHTNAVNGYCNLLLKMIDRAHDDGALDYMAVIFDAKRKNFRNDIYPEYKANRDEPPEELRPQFQLVRDATEAFGLPAIVMEGYEADDLIATYAREAVAQGIETVVVSSDKDLMQLVRDGVSMFDPMKELVIGPDEVLDKFGVAPDKVVDVQSLAGDSTDNVPGVPGIGVKTAAQLIDEYGDLDTLLDRAEEIKQPKRRENLIEFAEQARISRELVRLKDDVKTGHKVEDFALKDPDPATVVAFLKEMEFRTLTQRVENRFVASGLMDETETQAAIAAEMPVDKDYELVQDEKTLKAWIAAARDAGVVAFDTETTSLNAMRAELVGFSLSHAPGRACYVPVGHVKPQSEELDLLGDPIEGGEKSKGGNGALKQVDITKALKHLKGLIEDPSVLTIAHNAKYDLLVLAHAIEKHLPPKKEGEKPLDPVALDDTMLLSYVLDAGRNKHGLDELSFRHLEHENIKFEAVVGKGKAQISFAEVALDAALDYAAEDADMTGRLHTLLKARLVGERMSTVYETIERPLVPAIVAMEGAGIKADAETLMGLSKDFAKRMASLEKKAHKVAGEEFNVGSPKQLGEILFDKLGIEGGKKGKTGAYTTSADVLEDLAAQGHELPQVVLDWRQVQKLKSTYADALVEQIHPETGRIHTSYGMAIAQTGRLSSNDPNLQNIPVRTEEGRKIRAAFVAGKGSKLVSLDYSQIELRVVAHVAGEEALIAAFQDGQDIHAMTASQVFDVPLDGMDPMLRRNAKAINFGIIYGISAFGLARNLGIDRGEAGEYIKAYFERYPAIKTYMDEAKAQAHEQGFVETIFGRRIYLSGIKDKNQAVRGFAERQAINAPIQGAAADIIKRAMIRVPAALKKAKLESIMLLQVHDELLFEAPKGEVDDLISVVSGVMEGAAAPAVNMAVPLVADAGVGDTWDEAH